MATLNWKTPNGTTGSIDMSTIVTTDTVQTISGGKTFTSTTGIKMQPSTTYGTAYIRTLTDTHPMILKTGSTDYNGCSLLLGAPNGGDAGKFQLWVKNNTDTDTGINKLIGDKFGNLTWMNKSISLADHTHSNYLPLSGGTLTGHLNLNNVNLIIKGTALSPSDTTGAYKTLVQGVDTNSTQIGVVGMFESDSRHYATMRAFRGERYIGVTSIADSDATGHIAAQISNLTYNYTAASNALIRYADLKDFVGDYGGVSDHKKAVNGYIAFKDGIIMQWGQVDLGSAKYKDVTPSISFSTIYSVVITDEEGASATTYGTKATFVWNSANAPAKIRIISDTTGSGVVRWFAVGI